jgi:hypothetical protein
MVRVDNDLYLAMVGPLRLPPGMSPISRETGREFLFQCQAPHGTGVQEALATYSSKVAWNPPRDSPTKGLPINIVTATRSLASPITYPITTSVDLGRSELLRGSGYSALRRFCAGPVFCAGYAWAPRPLPFSAPVDLIKIAENRKK